MYPTDDQVETIAVARHRSLAGILPMGYLSIVSFSLMLLSMSKPYLSLRAMVALELPIIVLAVSRTIWWKRHGNDDVSELTAQTRLTLFSAISVGLVSVLIVWAVALWRYGDMETGNAVTFALCLVFMYALFWTVHVQQASLYALFLTFPLLIFLFITRSAHYGPLLAITFVASFCSMLPRSLQLATDYRQLVESRAQLIRTQKTMFAKTVEAQRLSDENWRIANTDMLTELGNRRSFFAHLAIAYAESRVAGTPLAIAILGLDGFKTINDSHSHSVGDQLLRALAERLPAILGPKVEPFRLGSDEFAMILRPSGSEGELMALAEHLIDVIRAPVIIGDLRLTIGCSIGLASNVEGVTQASDLYERADYALHFAKRSGRLRAVVFNEEHGRAMFEAARIERTLREANLDEELHLQFQPIVDARERRTKAFECLARWRSPALGSVPPDKFIVIAEKCGLIATLTPVLLRKALSVAKEWPEEVGLSFNLSAHDVGSNEGILNLIAVVVQSGFAPNRLEFEVTETALMMNIDASAANLMLLKQTGARIALDDFGTGYSSLSYIQRLPLDKIKVDGSFVKNLGESAASRKIVRSVTALSRDLDLECVVEGVETVEQLDLLKDIGCHLFQGFLYAKPLDAADVLPFLEDEQALGAAETVAA